MGTGTGTADGSDGTAEELRRLALGVVMGCFEGPDLPGWVEADLRDGLGALCLFGSNLGHAPEDGGSDGSDGGPGPDDHVTALTARVHALAPRCLVALDEEGGDVTRLDLHRGSRTVGAAVLGAVDDPATTRAVHRDLGRRLARAGVDLDLAPVLDVNSNDDNPVVGSRSFGADPALVARHGVAAVQGLGEAGVAACLKHFPGHGDTVSDSHVAAPVVHADAAQLRTRELVPFVAAVAAGAEAVMTAHVRVPALDPDRPASTSAAVTALLREELGFTGVLVTDALDMAGVSGPAAHGSVEAAAVASLRAGADLLCLGADWDRSRVHRVVDAVTAAVRDGTLPRPRLQEAADRVDRLGERAALRRGAAERSIDTDRGAAERSIDTDRGAAERSMAAARAALVVEGTCPLLEGAIVVRLDQPANPAVADVPWGLADALAAVVPDVTALDVDPADGAGPALAAAAGRPLVVVARDTHRDPAARAWLAAVTTARPDVVLVDLGWPSPRTVRGDGGLLVRAWGASAVSAAAVAQELARLGGAGHA